MITPETTSNVISAIFLLLSMFGSIFIFTSKRIRESPYSGVFWMGISDLIWSMSDLFTLFSSNLLRVDLCPVFGPITWFFRMASLSWAFCIIICLLILLSGYNFEKIFLSINYQHTYVWLLSFLLVYTSIKLDAFGERQFSKSISRGCSITRDHILVIYYSLIFFYVVIGCIAFWRLVTFFHTANKNNSVKRVHFFVFIFCVSWIIPILVTILEVQNLEIPNFLLYIYSVGLSSAGFWNYLVWTSSDPFLKNKQPLMMQPTSLESTDSYSITLGETSPSPSFGSNSSDATDITFNSISYFADYYGGNHGINH